MCDKICTRTNLPEGEDLLNIYCNDYDETVDKLATYSYNITNSEFLKNRVLFHANTPMLFDTFLSMFPSGEIKQHFNCNTCKSFFNRYGNLVYVNDEGETHSVIWSENYAVGVFRDIVKRLRDIVENAKITYVLFLAENKHVTEFKDMYEYGCAHTEGYSHFVARISKSISIPDYCRSIDESDHIVGNIMSALYRYHKVIDHAIAIASTGKLDNNDSLVTFIAVKTIINKINSKLGRSKSMLKFKYAFENYSLLYHLRSSVEGALMDDIIEGFDDQTIIMRFNDKMDPTKYKRPTSAPSEQIVEMAENIIAELNLTSSLNRRVASLDDIIRFIWREPEPKENNKNTDKVFANVKTKESSKRANTINTKVDLRNDPERISFEKFVQKVLPDAIKIFIDDLIPYHMYPLTTYVTASDYNAEPIIKWDSKDKRNPLNHYVYNNGSTLHAFNCSATTVEVVGIIPESKYMYDEEYGNFVTFVIKGCKDTVLRGGSALFPDNLRPELYPVRKVIESFSANKKLEDIDNSKQAACGMMYSGKMQMKVIVETENTILAYILDRFE